VIGILMAVFFSVLAIAELTINPVNSFVLFTIALVYLRSYKKGNSFVYVASIMAVLFAMISLLTLVASFLDSMILNEPCVCKLDYGLAGFVSLPLLIKSNARLYS